jgi:hypothetical protein
LVNINSESCILALPYSNTTFCATSIKLYFTLVLVTQIEAIQVKFTGKGHAIDEVASEELVTLPVKRSKGQLRKNPNITIFLQDNNT